MNKSLAIGFDALTSTATGAHRAHRRARHPVHGRPRATDERPATNAGGSRPAEPLTLEDIRNALKAHQQHMMGPRLTEREQQIVTMIIDGQTMGGIAEELFITERTVKFYTRTPTTSSACAGKSSCRCSRGPIGPRIPRRRWRLCGGERLGGAVVRQLTVSASWSAVTDSTPSSAHGLLTTGRALRAVMPSPSASPGSCLFLPLIGHIIYRTYVSRETSLCAAHAHALMSRASRRRRFVVARPSRPSRRTRPRSAGSRRGSAK